MPSASGAEFIGLIGGAATWPLAQMGFTGVRDVLDGEHNALIALSTEPKPEEIVAGLGTRFFITKGAGTTHLRSSAHGFRRSSIPPLRESGLVKLSTERVGEKARSLMTPVLGAERTEEVIRRVNALEKLDEVHELRPLLAG
jgi:hypothetical protein